MANRADGVCPCKTPLTNRHPHAFHKDGIHVRVCSKRCLDRLVMVKGDASKFQERTDA